MLWEGIRGEIFPYPTPSSCQQSCWWRMGWEPGDWECLALCFSVPFSWSPWALSPHSKKAHVFPICFICHSKLWELALDFVLCASPERDMLGLKGISTQPLARQEVKQYMVWSSFLSGLDC